MADNTVTSAQLADTIDLGSASVSGELNVYRTAAGTPAITLFGSISRIGAYGTRDGLERLRLYGPNWGQ